MTKRAEVAEDPTPPKAPRILSGYQSTIQLKRLKGAQANAKVLAQNAAKQQSNTSS